VKDSEEEYEDGVERVSETAGTQCKCLKKTAQPMGGGGKKRDENKTQCFIFVLHYASGVKGI
jgi:hypothetical protein